jgi:hypothetical protein
MQTSRGDWKSGASDWIPPASEARGHGFVLDVVLDARLFFLQAVSMRRRVVGADRQTRWTQNSGIADFIWSLIVKSRAQFS